MLLLLSCSTHWCLLVMSDIHSLSKFWVSTINSSVQFHAISAGHPYNEFYLDPESDRLNKSVFRFGHPCWSSIFDDCNYYNQFPSCTWVILHASTNYQPLHSKICSSPVANSKIKSPFENKSSYQSRKRWLVACDGGMKQNLNFVPVNTVNMYIPGLAIIIYTV